MGALHTHQLEMDPNSYDPGDGPSGSNHAYIWVYDASPTTEIFAPSGYRSIVWASGHKYAGRKCWLAWSFMPGNINGTPGRIFNFHNHPNWGGFQDSNPSVNGVSAVAFDYLGNSYNKPNHLGQTQTGLLLSLEPQSGSQGWSCLSPAEWDDAVTNNKYIDLLIELTIGTSGAIKVWTNGEDTPRINLSGVKTTWESVFNQQAYALWYGMYKSTGVSTTQRITCPPPRIGTTLSECLADGRDWTINTDQSFQGSILKSNGQPSWRHSVVTSRTTAQFRVPASLGGNPESGGGGGGGGGTPSTDTRIWFSPAETDEVKTRLANGSDSWRTTAWNNQKAVADAVVGSYTPHPPSPSGNFADKGNDSPYSPGWYPDLYLPGLADGHAAFSCAVAYLVTGTTTYADRAMAILRSWRDTYYQPGSNVGHYVAESTGFAIKMFMAIDMLKGYMSAAELTTFKTWANKWLAPAKAAADSIRDNPWDEPSTLYTTGGHTYSEVYGGNDMGSQMCVAVTAAMVQGGSTLTDTLNWVLNHTTPEGNAWGWGQVLDAFIISTSHSGGTHSGSAGVGETVEGHLRSSLGYGLFHWAFLTVIAEVARRAGFATDLWNYTSPNGVKLGTVAGFYKTLLQTNSISVAQTFYNGTTETFGSGSGTMSEFRAYMEQQYQGAAVGTEKTNASDIINWNGNAQRGANMDQHLFKYALGVFGQLTTAPGGGGSGGGGGTGADDFTLPSVAAFLGSQSAGTSIASIGMDRRRGAAVFVDQAIQITDIYAALGGDGLSSNSGTVKAAIYTMTGPPGSGGVPSVKVVETSAITIAATDFGTWKKFTLPTPYTPTVGSWILLALHTGGADAMRIGYLDIGGYFFSKADVYSDGMDSAWGVSDGSDTRKFSIFAGGTPITEPVGPIYRIAGTRTAGGARFIDPNKRVIGAGGGGL